MNKSEISFLGKEIIVILDSTRRNDILHHVEWISSLRGGAGI